MATDPFPTARGTALQPGQTNQAKPRVRMNMDGSYTVFGGGSTDWFGPSDPIAEVAPAEQRYRQWDYPTSINTAYQQKRGPNDLPYWQLYNFATYYDLARLLIERRKNQIAKLEWSIQPKDKKARPDARCLAIETALQRPDGEHFWQQWIKKLLNDMLVYDAAFVFPLRDVVGRPLSLEIPDGTTFKFLVDERGRTPVAPWSAYQQILHGVPAFKFTRDELFYMPFNPTNERVAGYSVIEQVVVTITMALSNQASQLSYFTNGASPDMILSVPETWTPQQVREWKDWWDGMLEGNLQNRRGTMFVPNGMTPINTKEAVVKTPLDEWIARVMCFAFGMSPAPFVAMMNRATAESAAESAKEDGIGPTMDWVRSVMDFLVGECFGAPDLAFRWQEEDETDPKTKAETNQIMVACGAKTINEWREEVGLDPLKDGNEPMFITKTGAVLLKDVINPPEPVPMPAPVAVDGPPTPPAESEGPGAGAKSEVDKAAGGAAALDPFEKRGPRAMQPPVAAVHALAKTVHGALVQVQKAIATQIGRRLGKSNDPTSDDILGELDLSSYSILTAELERSITGVAEDGFTDAIVEVGGDLTQMVAFGLPNTRAKQYSEERAAALIGSDASGGELAEATRLMIRSTITDALDNAWSVTTLDNALAADYAFSEDRAEVIARTELKNAMSAGNLEGWRASGVVTGKSWQVSNDDVCDICKDNEDAGVIGIDDLFPSGDDAPTAHPNCNCAVYPVVADDQED